MVIIVRLLGNNTHPTTPKKKKKKEECIFHALGPILIESGAHSARLWPIRPLICRALQVGPIRMYVSSINIYY